MHRTFIACLLSLSVVFIGDVRAAGCSPGTNPFTDIQDSTFFCTNTLWLRNANVTVGCEDGSKFCPDAFVPRSQMALFMNRLARALTPEIVVETGGAPQGDLDVDASTCQSSVYTVPPANQRFFSNVHANLSILTSGDADIGLGLAMSVNGGGFSPISTPTMAVHVPASKWTMAQVGGSTNIQLGIASLAVVPGQTVAFRVSMQRLPGSTTGEVTSTRCQLRFDSIVSYAQN